MSDKVEQNVRLPTEDRRKHDRKRLILDVSFNGADATGVASTTEISIGGLYMSTQASLTEGAELMIRIPCGDGQIVVSGEVVYTTPGHGVGVRFHNLSTSDQALLQHTLQT